MGASSAVDAIEGLVPIVGRPTRGSALWRLADGWKAQLSESTAAEATYLQVALLEWERAHNRHPDLTTLVEVHVPEGEGTTLLSGPQVGRLRDALDGLDLRGQVDVGRSSAVEHVPGTALGLCVGEHQITVPSDPSARQDRNRAGGDRLPLHHRIGRRSGSFRHSARFPFPRSGWVCRCASSPAGGRIGVWSAMVPGAERRSSAAPSWWRWLSRCWPMSPPANTSVPTGTCSCSSARERCSWHSTVAHTTPALGHRSWLVAVAVIAVVGTGIALSPVAVGMRALACGLAWNLTPYAPCRRLSRAMALAADQHAAAAQSGDTAATVSAFEEGRMIRRGASRPGPR